MDGPELAARIAAFPRWHYEFELAGQRTPVAQDVAHRQTSRRSHIFDPLLRGRGGRLDGLRVLDLGCNAGFWALAAVEAGAQAVLGVDARAMHVAQAELVFEVKGIDRSRFEFVRADVFDLELERYPPFDVALCLGLLYHVARPVELLELILRSGADTLVLDTALSTAPGSVLELRRDDLDDPRHAVGRALVLWPTLQAVIDLVAEFGYAAAVIEPAFDDWRGLADYRGGMRRALLCVRGR